jgi:bifunctional non-homologous end joining protein LigD
MVSAAKRRASSSHRQYQSGSTLGYVPPQLCKLVEEPPSGDGWVHETKFDGYRMQMHVRSGKATFFSRRGLDWTHRFPEIAKACEALDDCIIDGEACGIDSNGLPSFSKLTDALSAKDTTGLVYFVFDCLWGKDEDLRSYPLSTRKKVLTEVLRKVKRSDRRRIHYSDHHAGDGRTLYKAACRMKLEGIVSKRIDAPYKSDDRSGIWQKAKCRPAQEVVVGGWKTQGARFRSLLLGAWQDGRFIYIGHAGTGFNSRNLPRLQKLLAERASNRRPFENSGEPKAGRDTHWIEPTLVVEVAFATWTSDRLLRQVSFKGVREDKDARSIKIEVPEH